MKPVPRLVAATLICLIASAAQGFATESGDSRLPPPANVSAIAGNGRVKLTWSPVDGADGYRVYRAVNGVFQQTPVASTTSTSHVSSSLVNGTTYSFTVAAFTKVGDGPSSLSVTVTPLASPQAVASTAGDRRINLKWEPSAGATSYVVYRKMGGESELQEIAVGVTSPVFVDFNLAPGTRYQYQIRAINAGTESELSERASAVPFGAPDPDIAVVNLTPHALPDTYAFCDARPAPPKTGFIRRFFKIVAKKTF
jgi:fibronectin type 3 domain-containing protein